MMIVGLVSANVWPAVRFIDTSFNYEKEVVSQKFGLWKFKTIAIIDYTTSSARPADILIPEILLNSDYGLLF